MTMKVIGGLLAICALFGVLFGVHTYFDGRYAFKEALAQTNQDLSIQKKEFQIHRLENYLRDLKTKVWALEDRLSKTPSDITAKKELRERLEEQKDLEKQIKDLKK